MIVLSFHTLLESLKDGGVVEEDVMLHCTLLLDGVMLVLNLLMQQLCPDNIKVVYVQDRERERED